MQSQKKSLGKRILDMVTLESEQSWRVLLYPGILVLILITIVPTLFALYISMHNYNLAKPDEFQFVFLSNFLKAFQDKRFYNALQITAIFTAVSLAVEMVFGMCLALCLSKKILGKGILQPIILIPMITTPVIVGLIWKMFYDPQFGLLNYFLAKMGFGIVDMLGNAKLALPGLIIIDIWEWTPYVTLVLLAGLQSLPTEPFEAAKVDGAGPMQTFWHITVHLLKPVIGVAAIFRFMDLFKWMDTLYVVTNGGPGSATENLSFYTYITNFKFLNIGYAAAIAILMLLIITFICNIVGKKVLLRGNQWDA